MTQIVGSSGPDALVGTSGDDDIYPYTGNDSVSAGAGNDYIDASFGGTPDADTLHGDAGNDTIYSSVGASLMFGDDGDDYLDATPGTGGTLLDGGNGSDTLAGSESGDTMSGGAGFDFMLGNGGSDSLSGGDDGDDLEGGSGNDTLDGEAGHDTLVAGLGNDLVIGGAGNDFALTHDGTMANGQDDGADTLHGGLGNDTLIAGENTDQLFGEDGDDSLSAFGYGGGDLLDGGAGADTLLGSDFNDTLSGGGENDSINAAGGNDSIDGGSGNDTINAGDGDDSVDGGTGDDNVFAGTGSDTLRGGDGNDTLSSFGSGGNDWIDGGIGADAIFTGTGNNTVFGGEGNDTIVTFGSGDDSVDGGIGDDAITTGSGNNTVSGGDGNDTINASSGNDLLDGSIGDDNIVGGSGSDTLLGGDGNDTLTTSGSGGDDSIDGGAGNDFLSGGNGNNTIAGGEGNDNIAGGTADDSIDGGAGNDTVFSSDGNDTVSGGDGDDLLTAFGSAGTKLLDGGAGNDTLNAGSGPATLRGGAGNDLLNAQSSTGAQSLDGGAGNDTLFGGSGNDTLSVGDGLDNAYGGDGNDTYLVTGSTFVIDDTGGTDTAVVSASYVKLPGSIESVQYVDGAQSLPYWIDALLPSGASGMQDLQLLGGTKVFRFGFADAIQPYDGDPANNTEFLPFDTAQKAFARTVLQSISTVLDLSFVETTDLAQQNTIVFANNSKSAANSAYAYYPQPTAIGSDVFINWRDSDNLTPADGEYSALTLIHELGHALGLKHSFELDGALSTVLGPTEDSTALTVMSYTNANQVYWHAAYRPFDLAALQYLYGPSKTARTGNDTYTISTGATNFIWDGGGVDSIDGSALTQSLVLSLDPGAWSYVGTKDTLVSAAGQITINFGTSIENATGGSGADSITGTASANALSGGAGDDVLSGGAGDDTIAGGGGADTLAGGAGADLFQYTAGSGQGSDEITDWSADDVIRIGTTLAGGTVGAGSDPSGKAVQGMTGAGFTTLFIDTDGITGAEIQLHLDGTFVLSKFSVRNGAGVADIRYDAPDNLPTGTVSIAGTAAQNQVLAASNTLADADGLGTITYQWLADGAPIAAATGATYRLTQAQVDKVVSVTASYTDSSGTAESVTSAATAPVANVNDPPTGTVTISGTPTQDQTLTASNTLADDDGIGSITYQWLADDVAISGAKSSSLVLTQAQVGKAITVTASYVDAFSFSESVTSAATALVVNVNDPPSGAVTVSGTAAQNETLTAANTLADADGLGAVGYQWFAGGSEITGATAATYTLQESDVGKAISVRASYTDALGAAESKTSAATAAVGNVNDAPTGVVTITGTPTQKQALSASNTLADADGLGTIAYQWFAAGVAISGATAATFAPTQSEVGKAITVEARYTDLHGTAEAVGSSATAAVANVDDAPLGSVTITGTPTQRQTLTAVNDLSDADGLGAITYRWLADDAAIAGATASTLVLDQAQVGKAITVTASYTDAFLHAESVTSAATGLVQNVNDAPTGSVTIGGTPAQDQLLTASNSLADADGLGTIGYQWFAGGTAIAGATAATYLLREAEVGKAITVKADYVDALGASESVGSAATAAVANVNDAPTGGVAIFGAATRGRTLTATHSLADADGPATLAVSYQWLADGEPIDGASGSSLALTDALVGKAISVSASYTDGHGTPETRTSAATGPVAGGSNVDGMAYSWKTHVLLDAVTVSTGSAVVATQATGADGRFHFGALDSGNYTLQASRGTADTDAAINSADALAALRIAVGVNPNGGTLKLSPYQLIAADVNEDGAVNSADALAILRMAVKSASAPAQKWIFVNESLDLWNETGGTATLTRLDTGWQNPPTAVGTDTTVNLVGILRGDVTGSWIAPVNSTALDPAYFQLLGTRLAEPTDVFGFS